jgi:hypothetical protein
MALAAFSLDIDALGPSTKVEGHGLPVQDAGGKRQRVAAAAAVQLRANLRSLHVESRDIGEPRVE